MDDVGIDELVKLPANKSLELAFKSMSVSDNSLTQDK